MVSVRGVSLETSDLPAPMVIECTYEVGKRLLALLKNQEVYLLSLPGSFHAGIKNAPSNDAYSSTSEIIYFTLSAQCLRRSEKDADSQIPEEAPKTTNVIDFCPLINENLEWILEEDSVTGMSLDRDKFDSAEKQNFLAGADNRLSSPHSQMMLIGVREPISGKNGRSDLHLTSCIPGKAPYPQRSRQSIAGTHKLATTDDIDAELLRQTGGDLTKGFYIDPARCLKATRLRQPLASRSMGRDADQDVELDEQGWTVLDDLDKQEGNEEIEGVES